MHEGDKMRDMNYFVDEMSNAREIFWTNPLVLDRKIIKQDGIQDDNLNAKDVDEAEARLIRFAPYIERVFPETKCRRGMIESPLVEIPKMKEYLETEGEKICGDLYLKCDSHLPISGSVKARGGIYEVLKYAEELAVSEGLLSYDDDYSILAEDKFKKFFSYFFFLQ